MKKSVECGVGYSVKLEGINGFHITKLHSNVVLLKDISNSTATVLLLPLVTQVHDARGFYCILMVNSVQYFDRKKSNNQTLLGT